jgi:hypothetical protein
MHGVVIDCRDNPLVLTKLRNKAHADEQTNEKKAASRVIINWCNSEAM